VFCCFRYCFYYCYYYYYYYYIINTSRGAVTRALHNANDYYTGTIIMLPCGRPGRSANVSPGHVAADFNVRFNRERMHRITPLNVYCFNSGVRFELPRPVSRKNKNKIETIKIRAYYTVTSNIIMVNPSWA